MEDTRPTHTQYDRAYVKNIIMVIIHATKFTGPIRSQISMAGSFDDQRSTLPLDSALEFQWVSTMEYNSSWH